MIAVGGLNLVKSARVCESIASGNAGSRQAFRPRSWRAVLLFLLPLWWRLLLGLVRLPKAGFRFCRGLKIFVCCVGVGGILSVLHGGGGEWRGAAGVVVIVERLFVLSVGGHRGLSQSTRTYAGFSSVARFGCRESYRHEK